MRFVTVTWLDAWADGVDDVTPDNVRDKHRPIEMETRGWILWDDEDGVSIFYERVAGTNNYRGRTFIPRGMIKKVEDFPLKKSRSTVKRATNSPVRSATKSTISEETSESTHG